ncbi:conserved phage C-terminal domain-containing protein [Neobacillus sp. PS3-34]
MIDLKSDEWRDPKWSKFLRPDTVWEQV